MLELLMIAMAGLAGIVTFAFIYKRTGGDCLP